MAVQPSQLFSWFAQGYNPKTIASLANQKSNSRKWSVTSVTDVLSDSSLVSHELFKACMTIRTIKNRHFSEHYILRGLIFCGVCKKPFIPRTCGVKHYRLHYYVCKSQDGYDKMPCHNQRINADQLDEIVWNKMRDSLTSLNLTNISDLRAADLMEMKKVVKSANFYSKIAIAHLLIKDIVVVPKKRKVPEAKVSFAFNV